MQTYLTIEINRGTARARSLPQGFQAAKLWKWEFPRRSSKGPVLSCALRRTPGGTVFLYSDTPPRLPELPRGLGGTPRSRPEPLQLESATAEGASGPFWNTPFSGGSIREASEGTSQGPAGQTPAFHAPEPEAFLLRTALCGGSGGAFPAPPALGSRPASPPSFLPSPSLPPSASGIPQTRTVERGAPALGVTGRSALLPSRSRLILGEDG